MTNIESHFLQFQQEVRNQFARIDERFAQIDERFAQIDERFAQIDERFAQIDARFANMEARLTALEQEMKEANMRISRLEEEMCDVKKRLEHVETQLSDVKETVYRLEIQLANDVQTLLQHIYKKIDEKAMKFMLSINDSTTSKQRSNNYNRLNDNISPASPALAFLFSLVFLCLSYELSPFLVSDMMVISDYISKGRFVCLEC